MTKAKLKINRDFPSRNLKKDTIIELLVDDNNILLDLYWRRRLKDSKIDNCVEIVSNKKTNDLDTDIINKKKK